MILVYGSAILAGLVWAYEEYEKNVAAAQASASARAYADTTLFAELGQASEPTNIPAGGALPANTAALQPVSLGPL